MMLHNDWCKSFRKMSFVRFKQWGLTGYQELLYKVEFMCRSRRLKQKTETEASTICHVLRRPISIVLFIFKYFSLRLFSLLWQRPHKLVWRHIVLHCFSVYEEITSKCRIYLFLIFHVSFKSWKKWFNALFVDNFSKA